jgi:micrococcal nuclease
MWKYVILVVCILSMILTASFAITYSIVEIGSATLTYTATFVKTSLNASVATVVRVRDGDTIVIDIASLTNVPVRLLGVDTPEDVDPRKPVQYFSLQAAAFTKRMLTDKRVYLTYGKNKYGIFHRMLAYVWLKTPKGYVMFNALLIINGYGKYYPKYKFRKDYMVLFDKFQQYAQTHELGMWKQPKMVGKADALQIIDVHYNGKGEYVQIKNVSHKVVNLRGWKITSVPADKQTYIFPDISLKPGESVYVHSGRNAGAEQLDGINLIWTRAYMWNNKGDTCKLINSRGKVVDEFSYK